MLRAQPTKPEMPETSLDLDQIVFDGDRDLRAALLADKRFVRILLAHDDESPALSARRQLLLSALKLGPGIALDTYAALEEVRRVLVCRRRSRSASRARTSMPSLCRRNGVIVVGLTSEALRASTRRKCASYWVTNRTVLFDHLRMAPDRLFSDERLAPVHVARLCAWLRYAELTADRVGLLCADDFAAVRAFFKLTSGLSAALSATRRRLRASSQSSRPSRWSTEQDWFSTHPYSPLRVKALDLFARSETVHRLRGRSSGEARFHRLLGKSGKPLPEADLEREVARIMKLMDPSFLGDDGDAKSATREFLALAGLAVARADGKVDASEERALKKIVGKRGVLADATGLRELSGEAQVERLRQLGRELSLSLTPVRRRKLIEDLVAVALADRKLAKQEIEVLRAAAELLGVEQRFIAESLARAARPLD
jgi:uncharacterized tellurite resistance protein B-like protein